MSVNHDTMRHSRTGIPEIVLAEPKQLTDLISAIEIGMNRNKQLLTTRIKQEQVEPLKNLIAKNNWKHEFDKFERTLIISVVEIVEPSSLGVGIFAAGTSDGMIVEEIKHCLRFFGWKTSIALDVGVAGLHRFQDALEKIHRDPNIHCLIVVAGQDGALFSVVAGQTKLPIIAVPSPVGYGYGGKGETALLSALQACAPGVAVVNIENGFGAASIASKFLSQIELAIQNKIIT
jgi:NCAIR mutase (PurE)-related protein